MATLLNPFAFKTERREHRFYEIDKKPVFELGEYKTYNYSSSTHKWFITCRGNIIVTETTAVPKALIEALVSGVEPEDRQVKNHYLRTVELWPYAVQCAKSVGFDIIGVTS